MCAAKANPVSLILELPMKVDFVEFAPQKVLQGREMILSIDRKGLISVSSDKTSNPTSHKRKEEGSIDSCK